MASTALAGGIQGLDAETALAPVIVTANRNNLIGSADSANQGTVTGKQLENRPMARTGELLEAVPGVIVTQHSGDGKANQYFARGFNLDHGTDFRTTVLGMPVNQPTNAHGQGYSDLNFVIPELIKTIQYKKGTYYAEEGDFSAAGAAAFDYVRILKTGIANLELGPSNYKRVVIANSSERGLGHLLYALETATQDGPWENPEKYKRFNGVLSYSWTSGIEDVRITGMTLQSSWNATDQVPQRAIDSGLLSRFGTVDPTDGGETARTSLSANWMRRDDEGTTKVNAYLIQSDLDLFSNFTYALEDPVHGDQFHQTERRLAAGLDVQHTWQHALEELESETTAGLEMRRDRLAPVALYSTMARQLVATTREDKVKEGTWALYVSNATRWSTWFRSVLGVRSDWYAFDVASSNPANSGGVNASITSPKASLIFSPAKDTEIYVNWGRGFHSNDARGVTQTVDPRTGLTVDAEGNAMVKATPLVKAIGSEVGLRLNGLALGLQTSFSIWQLDLDSELVFAGDAGTTQAGRPSHRVGIEVANYYRPSPGWIIDADLAWSQARFTDSDSAGPYIPGALDQTASVGLSGDWGRWSGGLRLRYFAGRALVEDNSVRSPSSTLINAKLAYAISRDVKLSLEVLNLFNRQVSDIDYYYPSQLRGEAVPINDIHTHPAEPRAIRIGVQAKF